MHVIRTEFSVESSAKIKCVCKITEVCFSTKKYVLTGTVRLKYFKNEEVTYTKMLTPAHPYKIRLIQHRSDSSPSHLNSALCKLRNQLKD